MIPPITVSGITSCAKFLENTQNLQKKLKISNSVQLTTYAANIILYSPLICYVPKRKIGKSRVLSEEETLSMLQHTVHIHNKESFFSFLKNLPMATLEQSPLNIVFFEEHENSIRDHLLNMYFLESYKKEKTKTGKLDFMKLENSFTTDLSKSKKINDYIASSKKYSYACFLAINAKSFAQDDTK